MSADLVMTCPDCKLDQVTQTEPCPVCGLRWSDLEAADRLWAELSRRAGQRGARRPHGG